MCAWPPLQFGQGASEDFIWVLDPVYRSDYSQVLGGSSCLETLVLNFLKTYKLIFG